MKLVQNPLVQNPFRELNVGGGFIKMVCPALISLKAVCAVHTRTFCTILCRQVPPMEWTAGCMNCYN